MRVRIKSIFLVAVLLAGVLIVSVVFHAPILRLAGNYLIDEDVPEKTPVLFILSGDAWDRGNEAARLYKSGFAGKLICTGGNVPRLFLIAGVSSLESELTQRHLIANGVPSRDIELLCMGTSTKEEADYILSYCKQQHIKKLGIVSSKFHTRRIANTFRKQFEAAGLQLRIYGAPSSAYNENEWWKSENGLIFVNNEYIKILYYRIKGF